MNPSDWIAVDSSLLSAVRYSPDAVLELKFRTGTIYRYFNVPHLVFEELLAAESLGAYFNRHIRPRFPYKQLA